MMPESPSFEAECGQLLAGMVRTLMENRPGVYRVAGAVKTEGGYVDIVARRVRRLDLEDTPDA